MSERERERERERESECERVNDLHDAKLSKESFHLNPKN